MGLREKSMWKVLYKSLCDWRLVQWSSLNNNIPIWKKNNKKQKANNNKKARTNCTYFVESLEELDTLYRFSRPTSDKKQNLKANVTDIVIIK